MSASGIALIMMLLSFPLISMGSMQGREWLWWAGLIILAIGGIIPVVLRYTGGKSS